MRASLTGFFGSQNNNRGYAQIGANAFSYYAQDRISSFLWGWTIECSCTEQQWK